MLRSDQLTDTYGDDRYLRRWTIVGGLARCTEDAYPMATTPAAVLDGQRRDNALVRERMAAVEALEDARLLLARVAALPTPPAETVPAIDHAGQPTTTTNPAWAEWQSALAAERDADDLTRAYALVRQGRPLDPAPGDDPSPEWLAYRDALAVIEGAG